MFNKIRNNIRKHIYAYLTAFLLTLLVSAPVIAFPIVMGNDYQGINISHFGIDEHFFLSRGKDVLEGHGVANPSLRESKDNIDPYFENGEQIMLAPFRMLGISDKIDVVTIYNFYNFIGVFILALLIYAFSWQLSRNKYVSIASAAFVIGGYHIIYYKSFFYSDFNFYARAMYPYVSSLIFFLYLNLLVKHIYQLKNRYYLAIPALVFGLSFYITFYVWTFIAAMNFALGLIFVFRKEMQHFTSVVIIFFGGLLIGIPTIYRLAVFQLSDYGRINSHFFNVVNGHGPIITGIEVALMIFVIAFCIARKNDRNMSLLLSIVVASWIAMNQQIVTGISIMPAHYYWYFIVPLTIISSLYMLESLIHGKSYCRIIFLSLIAITFIHMGIGQYRSFFSTFDIKTKEQLYRPIIDAINASGNGGVILAPPDRFGLLFTIYTSNDLLWNPISIWGYFKPQRLDDSLNIYMYLNKKARQDFGKFIGENKSSPSVPEIAIYNDTLGIVPYMTGGRQVDPLSYLSDQYGLIGNKPDNVRAKLLQYGVKYIVWDKGNYPDWDLSTLKVMEVTHSGNVYLYSLI